MRTITTTLFVILFLNITTLIFSEKCHTQDKKALRRIKKSFNNPKLYSSWDPNTDCCQWKWVGCDSKTNRIFDFYIYDTNETLTGPFFPDIGDLPYLQSIEINSQPNLTGPIPRSLTNLKSLTYFSVSQSGLSGRIPEFLGEIKTLTGLVLHSNNLSGPIPNSFSLLTNLKMLSLERNWLTGPIPNSLSLLTNLELLSLERNRLTGPIPRLLGRLKKRVVLTLGRNRLSGALPAWLGQRNFSTLDLSRNKLKGDASSLFGESTKSARTVDLSRNSLVFNLSKVKNFPKGVMFLDITYNDLNSD